MLTAELHDWLRSSNVVAPFDGTLRSLIEHYQATPESPYAAVQENTRADYDYRLRVLRETIGSFDIGPLTAVDFTRWHRMFREPSEEGGAPRVRQAHGLMTMVRMLLTFGVSMRFTGCPETLAVISAMAFETPRPRTEQLTYAMAEAVVDLALKTGRRSVALAQALQFELTLRQVDVTGKWVGADDDLGGIIFRGKRWTGGLLWSHVSPELTIEKTTTKTAATGQWDLKKYPLVMKALAAYPAEERVGPMIVSEVTGLPYMTGQFSRDWRPIASEAGVPETVWNRDSRAGGITEGWDADASEKDLQRMATHSDPAMTRRYARNSMASTSRVADLRVEHRKRAQNKTAERS